MLDAVIYRYRLRRLRARKRSVIRADQRKYKEAEERGDAADVLDEIIHNREMEFTLINDEIAQLVTSRLLSLADDNLIPTPSLDFRSPNSAWVQSRVTNHYHLSIEAAAELRAAIRKEQRERSELFFKWFSGLTGLIGALIGLIALLLRLR